MKHLLATVAAALAIVTLAPPDALAQDKIRFGMAISKTGQNTPGANGTLTPNYRLWISELQAAGGITIKKTGKKVPVELVEYDDQSKSEEVVRLTERLIIGATSASSGTTLLASANRPQLCARTPTGGSAMAMACNSRASGAR